MTKRVSDAISQVSGVGLVSLAGGDTTRGPLSFTVTIMGEVPMGAALRRTSISPNIKERRDYSCAVFDGQQRVIAMGDHMPVHLGSMQLSVEAAVARLTFKDGDLAILNDPYAGGTHLPVGEVLLR